MSYETITYEKIGHKAVITLNRPESLNAFNHDMRERLIELTARLEEDDSVRCVVLQGAGDNFCAGGDIKMFREAIAADSEARRRQYREFSRALLASRRPIADHWRVRNLRSDPTRLELALSPLSSWRDFRLAAGR